VLLTGGSGNLGQTLVPKLLDQGDTPVILDVRAPPLLNKGAVFIEVHSRPLEAHGDISRL
jgi:nucleoside-diphosphate-sugar epimerase